MMAFALLRSSGRAQEAAAPAPSKQNAPASKPFKPEELEQLVAPIALYPDALVSQILMASTYPLEVVEAARWVKANQNLKGDKLTAELEKKSWDPSVKSLVNFPQVLAMMDQKLEWTQKLGDAVLAQQKELMDTIQKLRAKAQAQGNLKTNEQQKVVVEEKIITIVSTSPQVIYVPTYNPTVVYGPWPYAAYPPYYYYPPGYVAASTAVAFGVGMAVGAAWGNAYGNCNWHGGDIDIDVNRNINVNQNVNRSQTNVNQAGSTSAKGSWQHDPQHRKGANYRDSATAQKYNKQGSQAAAQSREAYRGRTQQSSQQLATASKPSSASKAASTSTAQAKKKPAQAKSGSGSALQGYEGGKNVKSQADRGYQSRQSSATASRSSGGSRAASSSTSRSSGARSGGGRRR